MDIQLPFLFSATINASQKGKVSEMIETKAEISKNLEKALQELQRAKQHVTDEKKKQNEKKRKAENHHQYIMGGIALPIVSEKYLAKIPDRDKVQDIDNAKNFLEHNSIITFAQLEKYKTDKGKEFDRREQIFIPKWLRLEQLKELAKAYSDYEPYKAVHEMSKSLSGLKKLKYDKEHELPVYLSRHWMERCCWVCLIVLYMIKAAWNNNSSLFFEKE